MAITTVLEYAYMSQNVYFPAQYFDPKTGLQSALRAQRWEMVTKVNHLARVGNAFFARFFIRTDLSGEIIAAVVAFRGTQFFAHPQNDASDMNMAIAHELPTNYCQAIEFCAAACRYLEDKSTPVMLTCTGHSLGGALAQLTAIHECANAVAFNSPGIGLLPGVDGQNDGYYNATILNINSDKGLVNRVGKMIGTQERVKIPLFQDFINRGFVGEIIHQHEIASVIDALHKNEKVAGRGF